MSRLSDNKLQFLKGDYGGSVWYITKQNCNFRDLAMMARILEMWNDDDSEPFQTFFDRVKTTSPFSDYISNSPHRALKNCEFYGLMTPVTSKSKVAYSANNLTEVYQTVKRLCNNNFQEVSKYQEIINRQLEMMKIVVNDKDISPIMYTLKVLLTLGDVTGNYTIQNNEFKLFVSTCDEWSQFFQSVESILRFRDDAGFQKSAMERYKIANETRFNLVFDNLSYIEKDAKGFGIKDDCVETIRRKVAEFELGTTIKKSGDITSHTPIDVLILKSQYSPMLSALRTKPFLLLAGISGTGKSQKVQELAFMSCPEELREEDSTTPGNYCLVEVKPNWHDSTELLGYYSALSGRYELTDFIRFTYKALTNPNTPFFLCLDEMNLAPVEQYFAEYLSVLETRKRTIDEEGVKILTEPLLTKDKFSNCSLNERVPKQTTGYMLDGDEYDTKLLYSPDDANIIAYMKNYGLHLPDNLFVIGTVNMDDTTHQFSRKVIDRAFTIEMNGGKMDEMFSAGSRAVLEYRDKDKLLPLSAFKSEFVRAYEVLEDDSFAKYADTIKARIPELLGNSDGTASEDSINGILKGTPFRVSYRVQNELVLYLSVLIENAGFPDDIESLIGEATLVILMEKVLPRIQGEQKQLETKGGKSNVLKDMKSFVETHFKPSDETVTEIYDKVIKKLDEMDGKLSGYYTNFF